jgi:hemolysin III
MSTKRPNTLGEEIANAVTHGIGLLLSIAALPILVVVASGRHVPVMVVGMVVFASSLIALYAASTMYHALPASKAKQVFRVIDHAAIYLLIAGTYTPFTLGVLRGAWGWSLFGVIWTLALLGVLFKTTLGFRYPRVSTALYVAMGWMIVIALKPMLATIPMTGLLWLLAGGLCYTGGVAFYVWDNKKFAHAVWHLFVLGGSVCHFVAVLLYAVPRSTLPLPPL